VLDELELARHLSLPLDDDSFTSPLLRSYRVATGVVHNPANDRRTLESPQVRALFTRGSVLASPWYAQRLHARQAAARLTSPEYRANLVGTLGNTPLDQAPARAWLWQLPARTAPSVYPPVSVGSP
jgi:hypothetical protein